MQPAENHDTDWRNPYANSLLLLELLQQLQRTQQQHERAAQAIRHCNARRDTPAPIEIALYTRQVRVSPLEPISISLGLASSLSERAQGHLPDCCWMWIQSTNRVRALVVHSKALLQAPLRVCVGRDPIDRRGLRRLDPFARNPRRASDCRGASVDMAIDSTARAQALKRL